MRRGEGITIAHVISPVNIRNRINTRLKPVLLCLRRSGLAAMPAAKRSAGVAPEVNLRNPSRTISQSTFSLKSRTDVTRILKHWYQRPHKQCTHYCLMSSNFFLNFFLFSCINGCEVLKSRYFNSLNGKYNFITK